MERISGDGFFSYRREVRKETEPGKKSRLRTGKRSFFTELAEAADAGSITKSDLAPEETEAETSELLDAVFEAGDRLKNQTDLESLRTYKEAVRRFISVVVKRALDVEERLSGAGVTKRKRYALIQVIDDKLERLAASMIGNQRNQLDILARIDEINGLIVDLKR